MRCLDESLGHIRFFAITIRFVDVFYYLINLSSFGRNSIFFYFHLEKSVDSVTNIF